MIDKIGTFFRPTINNNKERDSKGNSGKNSHSETYDENSKEQNKKNKQYYVNKEKIVEVIKEINEHAYYQEKNLSFSLTDDEQKVSKVQVVNKETNKIIQNLPALQVLKIHQELLKKSSPSNTGNLINIKC